MIDVGFLRPTFFLRPRGRAGHQHSIRVLLRIPDTRSRKPDSGSLRRTESLVPVGICHLCRRSRRKRGDMRTTRTTSSLVPRMRSRCHTAYALYHQDHLSHSWNLICISVLVLPPRTLHLQVENGTCSADDRFVSVRVRARTWERWKTPRRNMVVNMYRRQQQR